MSNGRKTAYNSNEYRRTKLRKAVIHTYGPDLVCHLCKQPIDLTIKYPSPWSFSVDHYIPQSKGGDVYDISNACPSHLRCNQSRGSKPASSITPVNNAGPRPTPSRDW